MWIREAAELAYAVKRSLCPEYTCGGAEGISACAGPNIRQQTRAQTQPEETQQHLPGAGSTANCINQRKMQKQCQRPPHSLLCAGAAWLFSSRRMTLLEAVRGRLGTSTTLCTLNNGLRACLIAA